MPNDKKAVFKKHVVMGHECLIVQKAEKRAEKAILYFFGGGMMITPSQDRLNSERELSIVAVHCKSRLKLLTIFPKIFKGEHVSHTDVFESFVGKDVRVEFDRPVALQIDGETVLGVTSYTAKSNSLKKQKTTL